MLTPLKIENFLWMFLPQDEKWQNEPTTNEERVQLRFWGKCFQSLNLVSNKPELVSFRKRQFKMMLES